MDKKPYKQYSVAFKKQVVREYEAGESASYLRKKYGISGGSTVTRWVKQYGLKGSRYKLMVIQKPEEQELVKQQAARIQLLESALADAHLNELMLTSVIEVADEELGIDLKKTFGPKPLTKPEKRAKP